MGGTGNVLATTNMSVAFNEAQGANIASASTTDIGAATGNYVNVTGTTTITALGTVQAGTRRIVNFNGALTLTYNATSLILPTSANITTAAGDTATFVSMGSGNWVCTSYQKKDGTALVAPASGGSYWTAVPGSPTRTGNTTFTVTDTSNANLYDKLLSRQTVIKWTESGTVRKAMVVSATYATNTVTVTIIGDTLTSIDASSMKYAMEKAFVATYQYPLTIGTGNDIIGRFMPTADVHIYGYDAHHGTAGTTNSTTYTISKNSSSGASTIGTGVSIASGAVDGNGQTATS